MQTSQATEKNLIEPQVYPNPASNKLTINLGSSNEHYKLEITDITGKILTKLVLTQQLTLLDLDSKNGLIFLKLENLKGSQEYSFKVLID